MVDTTKMSDLNKKQQKDIFSMIASNSLRNFQMMNSLHTCVVCGESDMIFGEIFLKLGFEPKHVKCTDENTTHNLNIIAQAFKTHDSSSQFKWIEGKDDHRKNESGRGCQTCQAGMVDE